MAAVMSWTAHSFDLELAYLGILTLSLSATAMLSMALWLRSPARSGAWRSRDRRAWRPSATRSASSTATWTPSGRRCSSPPCCLPCGPSKRRRRSCARSLCWHGCAHQERRPAALRSAPCHHRHASETPTRTLVLCLRSPRAVVVDDRASLGARSELLDRVAAHQLLSLDAGRWGRLLPTLEELWHQIQLPVTLLLVSAMIVWLLRRTGASTPSAAVWRAMSISLGVLALAATSVFGVYLFGPYSIRWWLGASLNRTTLVIRIGSARCSRSLARHRASSHRNQKTPINRRL